MKAIVIVTLIIISIFVSIVIWQKYSYRVPEPAYSSSQLDSNISIREYGRMTIAEVKIDGERYEAIQSGFRLLANYIFGGNKQKMKIAMTAPVIQSNSSGQMNSGKWIIRFVMPAGYDIKTLPQPNDPQVKLTTLTKMKYIVIRFSGSNSESNLNDHLDELQTYVNKHGIKTQGNPIFAFYNPPWILPFLRRNEIMLELSE